MAGLIPGEVVGSVLSSTDIVDLIGGYLPLRKAGRSFKALCPFHNEKTPSFTVNPDRQIFHCFGCNKGGDAASFLMLKEGFAFPEAIEFLAQRAGIPLPRRRGGGREEGESRLRLYDIQRAACEYFRQSLRGKEGEGARAALAARGILPETVERFLLGYAPGAWEGLVRFLTQRGFPVRLMEVGGLVVERQERKGHYDRFRDRLMIPIQDPAGKVLGFGGRALGDQEPKYMNSPETPIYRKGHHLFGLPVAARALREGGRAIVVEGYFDFLKVYRSGFRNVVATLGTSLTEDHVRVLKRFVQEAIVVFDGDQAGEAASLRGLEVFLEGEMSVKVAVLPAGRDPDTFIDERGPEAFKKIQEEARDFFDFKWESLSRRYRISDPAGMLRISGEFLDTLSRVKNPLLLDRYLRRLAELLGVGENSLRGELVSRQRKARSRDGEFVPVATQPAVSSCPEEEVLVSLLLEDPSFWERAEAELHLEDFKSPGPRELFQVLGEFSQAGTSFAYGPVLSRVQNTSIKSWVTAHSFTQLSPQEREKAFSDCLRKIRQKKMNERLERLRQAIRDAEGGGEKEKVSDLLQEYRALLAER